MTQEEKAKAYDEALDRMKYVVVVPKDEKALQALKETIFPELAESEDEKIRKEINILYSDIDTCISELVKARTDKDSEAEGKALFKMEGLMVATLQDLSCIEDYLEKQKEQDGEDEEDNDFIIYHPLKNGKGEYECIPYSFYGSLTSFSEDKDLLDFLRTCFYTEEECNVWIEQQKEDEGYEAIPVESTLEYKLGFKTGKESEKQKEQTADNQFPPLEGLDAIKAKYYDKGFKCGFDEGIDSAKPAEWSEDDEQWLESIIKDYEDSLTKDKDHAAVIKIKIDFLKSLRIHWKPSEQEKGALRTAIYILTNERNFPKAAAQLQNILDAFEGKESRKDWKPSEEQMEALKWLVEYVSPSEKYIVIVKNLYEQLKKFT